MTNHRKMLVALGAGALAVISLMGYLIWSGYQQAIQAAEITTRNYASIMEARLDATLRRVEADLGNLARMIPVAALSSQAEPRYAGELNFELRAHLVNFPELTGIRITDASGERLYTSDKAGTPRTQVGDRDYFRLLRDNPGTELVYSEVIASRLYGRPSVVVGKALRDGQGAFRGIVFAVLELSHFQKLFQSLNVGTGGIVAFYRSGTFSQVVRWPPIDEALNVQLPPDSLTRKALVPGKTTATLEFTSRRDGIARIYSYHVLNRYPFFVAVGVARDEILAAWRERSLAVALTSLSLLGLLAVLLFRLLRAEAKQAQATTALVQSEWRFRNLFNRASDGIMVVAPSGKLVGANESFARMHGYTTQEVQALSLKDLDTPETRKLIPERMRRIISGKVLTFEVEHYHKDGHIVQLEVSASLIESDGETLVQCFHRDIGERRKFEQAREESNARLQLLFEHSPLPLVECDFSELKTYLDDLARSGIEDWQAHFDAHPRALAHCVELVKVLDINETGVSSLGASGKTDVSISLDYFLPESFKAFQIEVIALARGQTRFEYEMPVRTMTGDRKIFSVTVAIVPGSERSWARVLVSFWDITAHKQAQTALQENEYRWKFAIEGTGAGVLDWNIPNGEMLFSDRWLAMTGYSRDELAPRPESLTKN